ncbi:MAG TPA: hypothetical protein PKC30_02905 [Saprospiraceae bacterium]|nr:hypothetical protein [Saprospiraceae bacterium]
MVKRNVFIGEEHKLPENLSYCDFDPAEYDLIKRADIYFSLHCQLDAWVELLHQKYNYRTFDDSIEKGKPGRFMH